MNSTIINKAEYEVTKCLKIQLEIPYLKATIGLLDGKYACILYYFHFLPQGSLLWYS